MHQPAKALSHMVEKLHTYIEEFNKDDEEIYTQPISNQDA